MPDELILRAINNGVLKVNHTTGEVFSIKSNTPNKAMGAKTRKGYLRTCINVDGTQHYVMIHRVVCIAVHGMPQVGSDRVNHINGVKSDNRPVNLEWVNHVENMAHSRRLGLHAGVGRRDGIRDNFGRFGFKIDGREWKEFPEVKP